MYIRSLERLREGDVTFSERKSSVTRETLYFLNLMSSCQCYEKDLGGETCHSWRTR